MNQFQVLEQQYKALPPVLKLDVSGQPICWIGIRDAVIAVWNEKASWHLGSEIPLRGGYNKDGSRSIFMLPSIIACDEVLDNKYKIPTLTNPALFRRDGNQCMYCGNMFSPNTLTRDHIIPTSKGGENKWTNVVASCSRCNQRKADRTPEQAGMQLIAVPYVPCIAEKLILENRRILADQSEYLRTMIPSDSQFWKRHAN